MDWKAWLARLADLVESLGTLEQREEMVELFNVGEPAGTWLDLLGRRLVLVRGRERIRSRHLLPPALGCEDCWGGEGPFDADGRCPDCASEAEEEARAADADYLADGTRFADPGGVSALRAATPENPRNLPCPSCGAANRLTPADQARGYQCDACADLAESGRGY